MLQKIQPAKVPKLCYRVFILQLNFSVGSPIMMAKRRTEAVEYEGIIRGGDADVWIIGSSY